MRAFIPATIILLSIGTVVLILFTGAPTPPVTALERAQRALERADEAGALRYADSSYHLADDLIRDGWIEMARQKGRLPRLRDYARADSLLARAAEQADLAFDSTGTLIQSLRTATQGKRRLFRGEIVEWREALNGTITINRAERYLGTAELAHETSGRLIARGEYEEALEALERGEEALRKLGAVMEEYTNDEARKIHLWRSWVHETVQRSKQKGGYAVIVDKSKHTTYLIRGGELVHEFACELGYNPARQKAFAGDGATPEGRYRVTAVKKTSKYYKALLIDYPNAEDRKRFEENKAHGVISGRARIGGLIEVHGHGGRGRDWTDGCVALSNDDIDRLMRYVKVGTPVTIVRRSDAWP